MGFVLGIFTTLLAVVIVLYIYLNPEKQELNENNRQQLGGTYIHLSDGVTHYQIKGDNEKKRVVLLHGGTVPSWMWDAQTEALSKAGFQTLCYDMYGRGYSDRPSIIYDRASYQRQLRELLDALGWQTPVDLIGHSFGGAAAVNFAAAFPERIKNLALISPVMKNYPIPQVFRLRGIGEIALRLFGISSMKKRVSQWLAYHPNRNQMIPLFEKQMTYQGFQRAFLSMARSDAFNDYSTAYQSVGQQKHNSLLIWGTQDSEVKKEIIDNIRSLMPSIQLIEIESAGHGIVFEAPEKISQIVTAFLAQPYALIN